MGKVGELLAEETLFIKDLILRLAPETGRTKRIGEQRNISFALATIHA